jgi:hypothetical protein
MLAFTGRDTERQDFVLTFNRGVDGAHSATRSHEERSDLKTPKLGNFQVTTLQVSKH